MYSFKFMFNNEECHAYIDDFAYVAPVRIDTDNKKRKGTLTIVKEGVFYKNEIEQGSKGVSKMSVQEDKAKNTNVEFTYIEEDGTSKTTKLSVEEFLKQYNLKTGRESKIYSIFDGMKEATMEIFRKKEELDSKKKEYSSMIGYRRRYLEQFMEELGFTDLRVLSKESINNNSLRNLRRVGERLDGYVDFSKKYPNISLESVPQEQLECLNFIEIANFGRMVSEEDAYIAERKETIECQRELPEDDFKYLRPFSRVAEESRNLSWVEQSRGNERYYLYHRIGTNNEEKYFDISKKIGLLLLGVNYDLLSLEEINAARQLARSLKLNFRDLTSLDSVGIQDEFSKIIDRYDFETACEAEDEYYTLEGDRYIKEVEPMMEGLRGCSIGDRIGILLDDVKDNINSRAKKREEYNDLKEKMDNSTGIRFFDDDE